MDRIEPTQAEAQRFLAKVDKRGPDECWPWLGARASVGADGIRYGRAYVARKGRPAAQVAWEIYNGRPFPPGKMACHRCDNPICVNPSHIWPGTQSENILDCAAKGRHPSKPKTHCKHGHELSAENRIRTEGSWTRCRQCNRTGHRRAMKQRRDMEQQNAQG